MGYLEGQLSKMDDPYLLAITSFALKRAGSSQAQTALDKLEELAIDESMFADIGESIQTDNLSMDWSLEKRVI